MRSVYNLRHFESFEIVMAVKDVASMVMIGVHIHSVLAIGAELLTTATFSTITVLFGNFREANHDA